MLTHRLLNINFTLEQLIGWMNQENPQLVRAQIIRIQTIY
ncbi:hypothetical protein VCRA2126O85_50004 [Vibrio crassostreae]|nr:hypothetical protein VCRA2128O106_50004 [Vibrio crassostreae]CAK3021159.1 hypothetical protein VCRA2126O86_50004 [Vibrio crassostreae]CAK3021192.1 hypothetical protein VCRA2125O83_50004 [Vibrio crassostreae]CAK3023837.1 hypothetical protein VCRA2127O91_50004 [Vibrio crassostreae]CAK3024519.1 hypothetical protein VCRA2126O85_50004 [Vibrio crassostreae]